MVTIRAHFDGQQVHLDEPCELKPDTKLLVVVVPDQDTPEDHDHDDWMLISRAGLERAYGEHEPEYSLDAIIERNPDYAGN